MLKPPSIGLSRLREVITGRRPSAPPLSMGTRRGLFSSRRLLCRDLSDWHEHHAPAGADNSIHARSLVCDAARWAPNRSSVTPYFNSLEAVFDADPCVLSSGVWRGLAAGAGARLRCRLPSSCR